MKINKKKGSFRYDGRFGLMEKNLFHGIPFFWKIYEAISNLAN
jgi:hypothetical protein